MDGTLGLARGTVRVDAHDPRWADAYADLATRITRALDGLAARVEHVGSTAVADLPAKPIIDVAVGVDPDARAAAVRRLAATGFVDRGDQGEEGGHLLVDGSADGVRSAHVHVVALDSAQWRAYLDFRARLRADPVARDAYARLKQALAARHPDDRAASTDGKAAFIRRVLGSHDPSGPPQRV